MTLPRLDAVHSQIDGLRLLVGRIRLTHIIRALRATVLRVHVILELTIQIERGRADSTLIGQMRWPEVQFVHLEKRQNDFSTQRGVGRKTGCDSPVGDHHSPGSCEPPDRERRRFRRSDIDLRPDACRPSSACST